MPRICRKVEKPGCHLQVRLPLKARPLKGGGDKLRRIRYNMTKVFGLNLLWIFI